MLRLVLQFFLQFIQELKYQKKIITRQGMLNKLELRLIFKNL